MLDSREPRNGDFVRFVENLAKHPSQHPPPDGEPAATEPANRARDADDASAWRRSRQAPDGIRERAPRELAARERAAREAAQRATRAVGSALRKLTSAEHAARLGAEPESPGPPALTGDVIAKLLMFFGFAVLIGSFLDDPPPFADPWLGVALLAIGRIVAVVSRKL